MMHRPLEGKNRESAEKTTNFYPRDTETNKKTNIFLIIEYLIKFKIKLSTSHTLNGDSIVKIHEVRHIRRDENDIMKIIFYSTNDRWLYKKFAMHFYISILLLKL